MELAYNIDEANRGVKEGPAHPMVSPFHIKLNSYKEPSGRSPLKVCMNSYTIRILSKMERSQIKTPFSRRSIWEVLASICSLRSWHISYTEWYTG